ncbi:MAG TPA: hypothetical protein PKX87_07290, partial [Alphaproteobacteria bacterium]|nr:hypothetical protein [Alphaproteobacteria bacterium]
DSAAPSPAAAPESQPLPKEAPNAAPAQQPAPQGQQAPAAPEPARPAPSKGAPVRGETVAEAAQATPAPKASRAEALERARALLSQGGKAPGGLGNIESLSAQHLKDKGVEALWKHKNPALARALFEASGNGQARQALAFMDKHGMGLPKGGASAAMAEAASAPKPATPAPAAAPLEKGPGTGPRVAAKCTMTYPPMEGLTLECEVKNPTMYSGDRIDVVDATNRPDTRGKLTQIFYKAESKLRTLAEAISTNAFLKGRVAPVFVAADPGIQEYIQKGYVTPPNRSDVNLAVK